MNRTKSKITILSVYGALALVLIVGILVVIIGALSIKPEEPDEPKTTQKESAEIMFSDEITLFLGQTTTLSPYLMTTDGSITMSKFSYKSSCDDIVVDAAGNIVANAEPSGKATVTITDTKSQATKEIKVNVISALSTVLNVETHTGDKIGSVDSQVYVKDQKQELVVNTRPANVDIEGLCDVTITDKNGNVKNAFEVSFEQNKIVLNPVGIGEGILNVTVRNGEGRVIYDKDLEFAINMQNKSVSDAILSSAKKDLMVGDDFATITSLTVDSSITDLNSLDMLTSLKTLYIDSYSVVNMRNLRDDVEYYVLESAFNSYVSSNTWREYWSRIYPYDKNDKTAFYVIYHNGTDAVEYEKVTNSFSKLRTYSYEQDGKKFKGWIDSNGSEVTITNLKNNKKSVHAYSDWRGITYTVVYHIRQLGLEYTEQWTYDKDNGHKLKDIMTVPGYKVQRGSTFLGWTQSNRQNPTEYDVGYQPNSICPDFVGVSDGDTIHLYDVWKINRYYISFAIPTDLPFAVYDSFSTIEVYCGSEYELPMINNTEEGYEFKGWATSGGVVFKPGVNNEILSTEDGKTITLTAVFKGIPSFYRFSSLNGGYFVDENMDKRTEGYTKTLHYGDEYKLPTAYCEGKTFKGWKIAGTTYSAGDIYYVTETEPEQMYLIEAIWE